MIEGRAPMSSRLSPLAIIINCFILKSVLIGTPLAIINVQSCDAIEFPSLDRTIVKKIGITISELKPVTSSFLSPEKFLMIKQVFQFITNHTL